MLKLGGIDICSHDVTIVADLYRKRGYRRRKLYIRKSPIFPHKSVGPVPLFQGGITTNDHPLIVDAAGKSSICSTGKRDNRELALMQEEADIRTVSGEHPHNISQIIHAIGRGSGIGKARKGHLVKNTVVYHERALSVSAAKGTNNHSVFVHVVREGISRAGKPEVREIAVTEQKSRGMKGDAGAAVQKSDDGAIVIKSHRRGARAGGRRDDQILKSAFSGWASVL